MKTSWGLHDLRDTPAGKEVLPQSAPAVATQGLAGKMPAYWGQHDRTELGQPPQSLQQLASGQPPMEMPAGQENIEFPDRPNINKLKLPWDELSTWKAKLGVLASMDDKQRQDVLQKSLPGATFSADKFNNLMMTHGDQTVYVNKPGMRLQDWYQGAAAAAATAIAARTGAIAPVVKSFYKPVIGGLAGSTVAATSDLTAHALGAEKVVDAPRVASTGIFSGVGEAVLGPVARYVGQKISGTRPSYRVAGKNGAYTPEALAALQELNLDPNALSPAFKKHFSEVARGADSLVDAAKLASADQLPVPIPQTRATLTGKRADQALESAAASGSFGPDLSAKVAAKVRAQENAIRSNVAAIRDQIGGGVNRNVGGEVVQAKLGTELAKTKLKVGAAFDVARDNPAWVAGDLVVDFAQGVVDSIKTYTPKAAPVANESVKSLAAIVKPSTKTVFGKILGVTGSPILSSLARKETGIAELFDWRRNAGKLRQNSKDPSERAALGEAIHAFDDGIVNTMRDALSSGDPAAVKYWTRANALRRGQGKRFKGGDLIESILEKDGTRLKIAPEAVTNLIFGASDTGFVSKPELAWQMRRLRKTLGVDSKAFRSLKEEAVIRFASTADSATQSGDRIFSGGDFKASWSLAWANNKATMEVLFTPAERNLISRFADVAARTTGKGSVGPWPIKDQEGMMELAQKAAYGIKPVVGALLTEIPKITKISGGKSKAISALKTPLLIQNNLRPGLGAAAGAVAGMVYRDKIDDKE